MTIGKFGRPRGVHGEIYITPFTDLTSRLETLKELFIKDGLGWKSIGITRAVLISNRPVVKLNGISGPEDAARLTNRAVAVPIESLPKLADGSNYVHELIGADIIDADSGETLGELIEIEHYPANDVYIIRRLGGAVQVCAAVRQFVVSIDTEARKISIRADGLIDAH